MPSEQEIFDVLVQASIKSLTKKCYMCEGSAECTYCKGAGDEPDYEAAREWTGSKEFHELLERGEDIQAHARSTFRKPCGECQTGVCTTCVDGIIVPALLTDQNLTSAITIGWLMRMQMSYENSRFAVFNLQFEIIMAWLLPLMKQVMANMKPEEIEKGIVDFRDIAVGVHDDIRQPKVSISALTPEERDEWFAEADKPDKEPTDDA